MSMMLEMEMSADDVERSILRAAYLYAPSLPEAEAAKAAAVSADARRKLAKAGKALPDGSFPIEDESHLRSAIRLARTPTQRAHVKKRALALGKSNLIPSNWN